MSRSESIFRFRCAFVEWWWHLSRLVTAVIVVIYVYFFYAGRCLTPNEIGDLTMWIWYSCMAGAMAYTILAILTRGKDSESRYIKEKHPKTWDILFPRFGYNSPSRLAFLFGKHGDRPDERLEEIRRKRKRDFWILAYPGFLAVGVFFSFFFWRLCWHLNGH